MRFGSGRALALLALVACGGNYDVRLNEDTDDMGLNPASRFYADGRCMTDVQLVGIPPIEYTIWTSDQGTRNGQGQNVVPTWGANIDVYADSGSGQLLNGGIFRLYTNAGGVRALVAQGRVKNNVNTPSLPILHGQAWAADSWEVTVTPRYGLTAAQLATVDNKVVISMYGKEPAGEREPILTYTNALLSNIAFPAFPVSRIPTLLYKLWGELTVLDTGTRYLMVFDKGAVGPIAGNTPAMPPIPVLAGSTFSFSLDVPLPLLNGLWIGLSDSDQVYSTTTLVYGPQFMVGFQ
jgi:hypothetical protein